MEERSRRIFDALVEDHGRFVFVVPVDVDARLALALQRRDGRFFFVFRRGLFARWRRRGRPRRCAQRRSNRRGGRHHGRRGGRRCRRSHRRRRWGRRSPAHHRWGRRRRGGWEPTRSRCFRRRRRGWHAGAGRGRPRRLARHGRGRRCARPGSCPWDDWRRQAKKSLLARGGRRRRRRCSPARSGRGATGPRLLRREPIENVQIRTGLVAHRFRSLDS
jgi:hypothetical protein